MKSSLQFFLDFFLFIFFIYSILIFKLNFILIFTIFFSIIDNFILIFSKNSFIKEYQIKYFSNISLDRKKLFLLN